MAVLVDVAVDRAGAGGDPSEAIRPGSTQGGHF